jgi:hypothetical protein
MKSHATGSSPLARRYADAFAGLIHPAEYRHLESGDVYEVVACCLREAVRASPSSGRSTQQSNRASVTTHHQAIRPSGASQSVTESLPETNHCPPSPLRSQNPC